MSQLFGLPVEVVNSLATVSAVAISAIAFGLALWTAFIQQRHNRLSVRPLAQVMVRDMDGHIRVKLYNNGTGPLIIKKLRVLKPGCETHDCLIDAIPVCSRWTFFVGNVDERSIRPGASINLLELKYDSGSDEETHLADLVRGQLQHLTIKLKYLDIYRKRMPSYEKSLEWFGRTL